MMGSKVLLFWSNLEPNSSVFSTVAKNKEGCPTSQKFAFSSSNQKEKYSLCRLSHHVFILLLNIIYLFTIFISTLYWLYTQVMLFLILNNVQCCFIFGKGSSSPNHASWNSHHPRKHFLHSKIFSCCHSGEFPPIMNAIW